MKGVKQGALVWGALSMLVLASGVAAPVEQKKKQSVPLEGTISNPIYVRELPPEVTPGRLEEAKRATEAAVKAADENKAAEAKKQKTDEDLAQYTKELFYATTVLAVSTIGLLILGRNQMRDNKSAITAAQRSAAAAERSVTGLDRPWMIVSLAPPRPVYGGKDGNTWNVRFTFQNVGRMPALIKNCDVNIVPLDELPTVPPVLPSLLGLTVSPELVVVGAECETSLIGPSPEMVPKESTKALVIYGRLTYEGLDKTADHHTGFAMLVFGTGDYCEVDRVRLAAYLYRD